MNFFIGNEIEETLLKCSQIRLLFVIQRIREEMKHNDSVKNANIKYLLITALAYKESLCYHKLS